MSDYSYDDFSEADFNEAICRVLDANNVEYETEHVFKTYTSGKGMHGRRCDIYIPETDTAIELKLKASMKGVGQCVYYTRFCREAILLADGDTLDGSGHSPAVHAAAQVAPGVKYGLCIPGPAQSPPMLDIQSDDASEFLLQAQFGSLGDTDFAIVKTLGAPGETEYSGMGSVGTGKKNVTQARGERDER